MPTISSLRVYPVKGCKAICIDQGAVKETGERRFHKVDC